MSKKLEAGMRAEDEEASGEPGRREQRDARPASRAEGLECRAEEPACSPCITSCMLTSDPPKPPAVCLHGWWGQ